MTPLVECIPNFSEGRRPAVVAEIVAAIAAVPGVQLLGHESDTDHNRTVVTFAGAPAAVVAAAFAGAQTAQRLINLDEHQGAHPRLGATDVIPLVPLRDITMAECVALARELGARLGSELGIPVYLYEAAATRPERQNLADVRRGEYEALKTTLGTDPARDPDFGPAMLTPAGATIVGARPPLIAYNVYLATGEVKVAKAIAKSIRQSSGGFPQVKALGLLVGGRAQVSINMTDFRTTSLWTVWTAIQAAASAHGTTAVESEIVGLVPEDALLAVAQEALQLHSLSPAQLLERQLRGE